MKIKTGFFILILSVAFNTLGQRKSPLAMDGDKALREQDYSNAADFYEKDVEQNGVNPYSIYMLGECQRVLFNYEKAEGWYKKSSELNDKSTRLATFYYALMLQYNGKYQLAKTEFEKFKVNFGPRNLAEEEYLKFSDRYIGGCELALEHLTGAQRVYNLINPGAPLNSEWADWAPAIKKDENQIVISSGRVTDTNTKIDARTGSAYLDAYEFVWDGNWGESTKDTGSIITINGELDEGAGCFSADRMKFYHTKCYELVKGKRNDFHCAIYVTRNIDGVWSESVKLNENINPKEEWNSQPSLNERGDTLFFVSMRPGGEGMHDIYYSVLQDVEEDESWGSAINMGPQVNTPYAEMSPFWVENSKSLVFSSEGHVGYGGLDLFYVRDSSTAVNLGNPFNSGRDDFALVVGDKRGYLTSNRAGGLGKDDILSFDAWSEKAVVEGLKKEDQPDFSRLNMEGKLFGPDKGLASHVEVALHNDQDQEVAQSTSDVEGKFVFEGIASGEDYKVLVKLKPYSILDVVEYSIDSIIMTEAQDDVAELEPAERVEEPGEMPEVQDVPESNDTLVNELEESTTTEEEEVSKEMEGSSVTGDTLVTDLEGNPIPVEDLVKKEPSADLVEEVVADTEISTDPEPIEEEVKEEVGELIAENTELESAIEAPEVVRSEENIESKQEREEPEVVKKQPFESYKVQQGESLYHVARRFNMRLVDLRDLNGLKDFLVYPGNVLKVVAL